MAVVKITKIAIKDYRSCGHTEFSPESRLSILIGPNGSGKTTILSAIRLLKSLALFHSRRSRIDPSEAEGANCSLKVWYECDGQRVIYDASLTISTNDGNEDEILGSSESWYMHDVTGSKAKIKLPIQIAMEHERLKKHYATNKDPGIAQYLKRMVPEAASPLVLEVIGAIGEFVSRLKYYSASQFTNPSKCPISFEIAQEAGIQRGISITGHKRLMYDIYNGYRGKTKKFDEFLSVVGEDGIGLVDTISFEEVQTSSSTVQVRTGGSVKKKIREKVLVIPNFVIGTSKFSPNQLSEGTFKTLALIFYLVSNEGSLVMIEEPEVCVHHGLLTSIVELIKIYSKDRQVIVSTHSDTVLDKVDPESVFIVRRDEVTGILVTNVTKRLKKKEIQVLKEYLENEGSLGEYWKHGDLENG